MDANAGKATSGQAFLSVARTAATAVLVLHGDELEWANRAAQGLVRSCGRTAEDGLRTIVAAVRSVTGDGSDAEGILTLATNDGEITVDAHCVVLDEGRTAVWLRDLGDERAQQNRIIAMATAALNVAKSGRLDTTLNTLAREIRDAADLAAVQVVSMHNDSPLLRIIGRAGLSEADDFSDRLNLARTNGAQLLLVKSIEERRPIIVPHRRTAILHDPLWAPMHEIFSQIDWDWFGAFPIIARGRSVGVLIAFFKPGQDPDGRVIEFVSAMADQAALAVDYLTLLSLSRDEARRRERERIARDLHDSVVQQVFSMRLLAGALEASCEGAEAPDKDMVRQTAAEFQGLCRRTLADLRDLIFELRPTDLTEHGLAEAIQVHANAIEARSGLTVEVVIDPVAVPTKAEMQEDIYRIVQEALHNVVKHAQATAVAVRIEGCGDDRILVSVTDDGRGFSAAPAQGSPSGGAAAHVGLTSMRERAAKWGGRLDVDAVPTGGVRVAAVLPGVIPSAIATK